MQLLTWASLLSLAMAAPVIQPRGAQLIPGSYIIKLKDGASDSALQDTIKHLKSVQADHVYRAGRFKGFSAKLSPSVLAAVRKLPEVRPLPPSFSFRASARSRPHSRADQCLKVEYIEQDAVVTASDLVTQDDVPWGLARISHRTTGQTSYVYDESAGEGTCSYIIDTGIYVNHTVSPSIPLTGSPCPDLSPPI